MMMMMIMMMIMIRSCLIIHIVCPFRYPGNRKREKKLRRWKTTRTLNFEFWRVSLRKCQPAWQAFQREFVENVGTIGNACYAGYGSVVK